MNDQEFNLGFENDEISEENSKNKTSVPKKNTKKTSEDSNPDFEQSLQRLEKIVEKMERGELSLGDSMEHFEEGSKLANFCTAKLKETEKKIEILLHPKSGEDKWVPYSTESDKDISL